jgi:D-alanine-D-alanine ligase
MDVRVALVEGLPALPAVEITVDPAYPRRFDLIDYRLANVDTAAVERRAPARLAPAVHERLRELAGRVLSAFALRDVASLNFRVGADGEVWFLSTTAIPSFAKDGALFAAARAVGVDDEAVVNAVLRSAARRHGLTALLDATKPRPPRSARRTSLRVGLAFNMKRIDSAGGDDREAEYDAPATIQAITRAVESHGHTVVPLEATQEFPRALMASNVDVVFNIAEGMSGRNREAQVPSLCELRGIPYTGSDSATLSLCLDKALAKRLLADVDTPAFQLLVTGREKLRSFRYPVIVKPNAEGTSKGIGPKSVCDDEARLREVARELIERYGQPALVEEYVVGRELTVGLLGERRPRVLPPMEVVFLTQKDRPVYDYESKQDWQKHVRYECPAHLTKEELRAVERACRTTFMTLGCRDVARVDLRLTAEGRVYVLEVNPLPGLTPDYSDLCLIANGAKIDYRTLIGEILSGAIKRWQNRQRIDRFEETPAPAASSATLAVERDAGPHESPPN